MNNEEWFIKSIRIILDNEETSFEDKAESILLFSETYRHLKNGDLTLKDIYDFLNQ